MVFLDRGDRGFNRGASLSNENLPTLAWDVIRAQCSESLVTLERLEETGNFLEQDAYHLDVVLTEHIA